MPVMTWTHNLTRSTSPGTGKGTGHSRAALPPPVSTVLPSGLNATAWTWPKCWRGGPTALPRIRLHGRAAAIYERLVAEGGAALSLALSAERDYASAFVVVARTRAGGARVCARSA